MKKELSVQLSAIIDRKGNQCVVVLDGIDCQVRMLVDNQVEWYKKYNKRFTVTVEEHDCV